MSNRTIAQLAHVELLTPTPEQSLSFFENVIGLEVTKSEGKSVYLRGWGEWSHHSLQLTEGARPGLGHIAWRANSQEDLDAAAERITALGASEGWLDASIGHGPAFRYRGPGGHLHELFWELERYEPPADMRSPYPNRPQRYVPRGVAPRQIDHVTVATVDPWGDAQWYRDALEYRFTEYMVVGENNDVPIFTMLTTNEKSHDLGLVIDQAGGNGRIHHLAYWVDSRDELLRAADVLMNSGFPIETGPGGHGMGEQDYLYVREPGGLRVEINTGGYRLYEPDWEPVKWVPGQGSDTFYRNVTMPESMVQAFPPVDATEDEAAKHVVTEWNRA